MARPRGSANDLFGPMQYVHTSKKSKKGRGREGPSATQPSSGAPGNLPEELVAFATPLLDLFPGRASGELLRSLFSLAVLAWNQGHPTSALPLREALRLRDRLVLEFGAAWNEVEPVYLERVRARSTKWGKDPRFITDCHVLQGGDGRWELVVRGEERQ